jgi:hypothetical protein
MLWARSVPNLYAQTRVSLLSIFGILLEELKRGTGDEITVKSLRIFLS